MSALSFSRASVPADHDRRCVSSLHRPASFKPERALYPPSWGDHASFAFWIVDALRPSVFVELESQAGSRYAGRELPAAVRWLLSLRTTRAGLATHGPLAAHGSSSREPGTTEVATRQTLQTRIETLSRELASRDGRLTRANEAIARLGAELAAAERRGEAVRADSWQLRRAIRSAEHALAARTTEVGRLAAQVRAADDAVRALDGEAVTLLERLQHERHDFADEAARRAGAETCLSWSRHQIAAMADEQQQRTSASGRVKAVSRGLAIAMRMAGRAPRTIGRFVDLIAAAPGRLADLETIDASRLFDEEFYLGRNPDVVASGVPALIHYVLRGAAERRDPHPLFSTAFYVEQVSGLVERDRNPLHHYLTQGWRAGFAPHPLFDPIHYIAQYEDAAEVDGDPLTHYLEHGAAARRNPHPTFDVEFYLREHPDVRDAGVEPLTHFVLSGIHEERRRHPLPIGAPRPRRTRVSASSTSRIELAARSLAPRRESRPTILVVSHVAPWRPRAGNEYRVQRMLRWYRKQGYRVIPLIAPLPGEELTRQGIDDVAAEFGHVVQVHRDGRVDYVLRDMPEALASLDGTFTSSFADLLGEDAGASIRERELLNLERTFCHDAVISTVLHLQRSLGPHILQVEYIWMTRLLPLVRGPVLKVVDTHDVFSSIAEKVRVFGVRDVIVEPHEEAARLERADLAIAIQDDERAELRRLAPAVPIVTAGVDFDVVHTARTPVPGQILYVASYNPRNRKGLEDFVRLAWPRIQQRVPHAELIVVGSVAKAMAGRDVAGVRVLGLVDDLTARYQEAALVINPVVAGTGLKIKMLEALCHLRPIVTWPAGVDGLDPALAALCHVANDWYAFSEQVVRALTTRAHAGFTEDERAAVARLVSPEHVYASLDAVFGDYIEPSRPALARDARFHAGRTTAFPKVMADARD